MEKDKWHFWYEDSFRVTAWDLLKTLTILFFTTLVAGLLANKLIDQSYVLVLYLLAIVLIAATTVGYFCGLIASLLTVIGVNYLFAYPYFAFSFTRLGYPLTFFSFFIVSVVTSSLTTRIRQEARQTSIREKRLEAVAVITKKLLVSDDCADIRTLTTEYIADSYHCTVVAYLGDPEGDKAPVYAGDITGNNIFNEEEEIAAARAAYKRKEETGINTEYYSQVKSYYLPVLFNDDLLGVVGVHDENGFMADRQNRILIGMIIAQMAMSLERQYAADKQRQIIIEAEMEKMRGNLLRAISHDLRTPLTAILGASSAILENGDSLDRETHDKLVIDIREDSQWLIRMVENLLSVTRISHNKASVLKAPEAVEEIVGEAVLRVKSRFPLHKIKVKVPEELLMVAMDATLIQQVIINLIENAIKHSGSALPVEVDVRVSDDGKNAVFSVGDRGYGIAPAVLPYIFKSYNPMNKDKNADSSRGMGIGLSICQTIVNAHGGHLEVANREGGGAIFSFNLPIEIGEEIHE